MGEFETVIKKNLGRRDKMDLEQEQFSGGVSSDMEGLEERDLVGKELGIKGFRGKRVRKRDVRCGRGGQK